MKKTVRYVVASGVLLLPVGLMAQVSVGASAHAGPGGAKAALEAAALGLGDAFAAKTSVAEPVCVGADASARLGKDGAEAKADANLGKSKVAAGASIGKDGIKAGAGAKVGPAAAGVGAKFGKDGDKAGAAAKLGKLAKAGAGAAIGKDGIKAGAAAKVGPASAGADSGIGPKGLNAHLQVGPITIGVGVK